MKVIGKVSDGKYICEVEHAELEKLAEKYYGNLARLNVGDQMNLGAGYDFRTDIRSVCGSMASAIKQFDSSKATLHKFALMVAGIGAEADSDKAEAQS